jgi:GNAT superfamily N-acetyltransferase
MSDPVSKIDVRRVTPTDWPLVAKLFGDNGACGGCWCQYWQAPPGEKAWEIQKGEPNRLQLREEIEHRRCDAMIATLDGEAVGWCRFGPVSSFSRLMRSRKLVRENMADYALLCLFVARRARKSGIATALVSAAAEAAFADGACAIEGYAVVPKSGEIPAAFAWTGVPSIFEAAGFSRVNHDAGARQIYQLKRMTGLQ